MRSDERARRLVGDMPWVTEALTPPQIEDLKKQIRAALDAHVEGLRDVDLLDELYIPADDYVVEDADGERFVKK
jgi:hypothetical protein